MQSCNTGPDLPIKKAMATFLFQMLPGKEQLWSTLAEKYPEVKTPYLYAHLWFRLVGSKLEDRVEGFLKDYGISSGRFLILMILELFPDGMKPSEIASKLGVTQATVTGLIDGLTQSGYVERRDHAKDGRACVVHLTEQGQGFLKERRPVFLTQICGLYGNLSENETQQLVGLMEKLLISVADKTPVATSP